MCLFPYSKKDLGDIETTHAKRVKLVNDAATFHAQWEECYLDVQERVNAPSYIWPQDILWMELRETTPEGVCQNLQEPRVTTSQPARDPAVQ